MFYNHEILTSRKHGVATIWLVATLGSKSSLKRVNRKEINNVDVSKACEVIISPDVPMALRLQSHLLCGVSRVYSHQCSYVLADAQTIQNNIHQAFRQMRADNEIDPAAGKIRPELLLIPDDPTFASNLAMGGGFSLLPDFADLPGLGFSSSSLESSQQSSVMLPYQQSSSSSAVGGGIQIPASDSTNGGAGGFGNLSFGADKDTSNTKPNVPADDLIDNLYNDVQFSPDIDFSFDADGNMYDIDPVGPVRQQGVTSARSRGSSDIAAMERVRRQHEEAQLARQQREEDDFYMEDVQAVEDSNLEFTQAQLFPIQASEGQSLQDQIQSTTSQYQPDEENELADEDIQFTTSLVPQRRRRRKVIERDSETQIRTGTLTHWNRAYTENMNDQAAQKARKVATLAAKANAYYWVWGSGIGGIASHILTKEFEANTLLEDFRGEQLMNRLIGTATTTSVRDRDMDIATGLPDEGGAIEKDTAPDYSMEEQGRGADDQEMTDWAGPTEGMADYEDEDVEVGRDAPTPLPGETSGDRTSLLMPWNLSVSRHSSTRQTRHRTGFASQAGSLGSGTPMHSGLAQTRRGTRRLTSASPLLGRDQTGVGNLGSSLFAGAAEPSSALGIDDDNLSTARLALQNDSDLASEFPVGLDAELDLDSPRGFGTNESSHDFQQSLDRESNNFLEFVKRGIERLAATQQHAESTVSGLDIPFETLLPPADNSCVVAAQGLIHVLLLATKGFLQVVQEHGFGEVMIRVAD